ncbi:hypothetical protein CPB86DRAFT_790664 [Serendipita vermifera]|nr:hypothetical protein CPB86DRAFT_790664 [Serendipita vermifera]
MATAGLRTALDDNDNARTASSGNNLFPDPLATSTSTDTDSNAASTHSGNNNFIYIYSFLSTLFLLLCIALVILVRVLLRRRRLEALLNHPDSGAGNDQDATANVNAHTTAIQQRESRRTRRRKKHQQLGSKPYMSNAWIGSGPLPTSLSTEALLGSIQPFSASLAPPLEEEAPPVNGEKHQLHQLSYQHHQRQQASVPLVDYSAPLSHPEEATTHSTSNSISTLLPNGTTANKSRLLQLLALPKSVSISSCTVEEAPSSSTADRAGQGLGLALTTSNSINHNNASDPSPSSPIPLTPLTHLQPTNHFPSSSSSPSPLPPSPSPVTPTTANSNVDRVQVEFLIAMPRPPSLRRPRFGNQSTTSFGCPSITTESESAFGGGDARSIGADSSWSYLPEGELPELVVGVSTVHVPLTERGSLDRYTIARRAAMRSERR